MWILRQYDVATDELVGELELPRLDGGEAERILGFAPTVFGSTPLDAKQATTLAGRTALPGGSRSDVASFLDFNDDAAPAPAQARDAAPARRS